MWISPDNKIKKQILKPGIFGSKPTENCLCTIQISDVKLISQLQSEYLIESEKYPIVLNIGEANTALDREIEKCLQAMHKDELSRVEINFPENEISFVIKLCDFEFRGFIHEWDAKEKISIAQKHKEKGIELFKENRFVDASFRFSKGVKLLLSIPIPIEDTPNEIDGVQISEINNFRANLYNNLASCYYKENKYETVIDLCSKVLEYDENNVKALHKRGFAYAGSRNFEKSQKDLLKLLELDAGNESAKERLQFVNLNINKQEADYACIVKKMFSK